MAYNRENIQKVKEILAARRSEAVSTSMRRKAEMEAGIPGYRELEEALDERFYRVGRSAIVNLSYIARVTKTEVHLTDGSVVPLPRGAYDAVNRAIIAQN